MYRHREWTYNRVPCDGCGDVIVATPGASASCSCKGLKIEADDLGNAENRHDALPEWDIWDADAEIVICGAAGIAATVSRARRMGKPIEAILSFRSKHDDEYPDFAAASFVPTTYVRCIDSENEYFDDHPKPGHVWQAIEFGRDNAGKRLLVHCSQGIGRAPAGALAIIADRFGPGREFESVDAVLATRPCAIINRRMTALADNELGRDGALSAAVGAHPLLQARLSARSLDGGLPRHPWLMLPGGGGVDLANWRYPPGWQPRSLRKPTIASERSAG